MSYMWADFMQVAQDLMISADMQSKMDARYRTAIGRAYYAVYCTARDYLIANGELTIEEDERRDLHAEVRRILKSHSNNARNLVSENLNTLREYRNSADYDSYAPNREVGQPAVERCIALADRTLESIGHLPRLSS